MFFLQGEVIDVVDRTLKLQDVTTHGVLVFVIVLLVFAIRHQQKQLKEKDDQIRKAVENHISDIQKHADNLISLHTDTNKLIEELKKIYSNGKTA